MFQSTTFCFSTPSVYSACLHSLSSFFFPKAQHLNGKMTKNTTCALRSSHFYPNLQNDEGYIPGSSFTFPPRWFLHTLYQSRLFKYKWPKPTLADLGIQSIDMIAGPLPNWKESFRVKVYTWTDNGCQNQVSCKTVPQKQETTILSSTTALGTCLWYVPPGCFHLPPKPLWAWTLLIGQTWVPCPYPSGKELRSMHSFHSQSLITEGFLKHGEGPNCWIVQGGGRKRKMFTIHLY